MLRLLLLLLLLAAGVRGEPPTADRDSLLSFLSHTPHSARLRWDPADSACNWTGVQCDGTHSVVVALHLPGTGLSGTLRLPLPATIRILSLRSNGLSGALPNLSALVALHSLYLQGNHLSGPIPALPPFLARLDLSSNNLSGAIPFSLNNLVKLKRLDLRNNALSGELPNLALPALSAFNVSYNRLNGSIPRTLAGFPSSAFLGNLDLCGDPLPPCTPFFPSSPPSPEPSPPAGSHRRRRLSSGAIAGIAVGAAVLLLLLLLAFLVLARRRRSASGAAGAAPPPRAKAASSAAAAVGSVETATGTSSTSKDDVLGGAGDRNKLIFLGSGGYSFDLEDLLRASAEVLGKGATGTSYKAVLEDSTTVVVKRLKDVGVDRKAFDAQMAVLSNVQPHRNVVPLRAYYFSKDEKLLVSDYLNSGSLSALLHGGRGSGRPPLDWDNRLRIALAVGRGLVHLHVGAGLPHGNVKASNVLLQRDPDDASLSDYALHPLFAATAPAHNSRAAGYRAPEVVETRRPTFKADVYSFGVLLLELLTGKAPNQPSAGEEGIDLPRWVQSVVRDEWTAEVFDIEIMRDGGGNFEEEMVELLQIALSCVSLMPDTRPEMADVVKMMEKIARRDEDWRGVSSDDPAGPSQSAMPAS